MDPIAATNVHVGVWERFVPRRSRVPAVSIDLLMGAASNASASASNTATAAAMLSATHAPMLAAALDAPSATSALLTPAACEQFLRYLLSDDTALPAHSGIAQGNEGCVGLLAELAKTEAEQEERRRAEAAASPDSTTENGELYDENKSQTANSRAATNDDDLAHSEKKKRKTAEEEGIAAQIPEGLLALIGSDAEDDIKEQMRREAEQEERREAAGAAFVPLVADLLDVAATHSIAANAATRAALKACDKEYGAVLYGAYGCADDAQWALSTRSVQCHDTYDAFLALRMSTRLAADLRRQLGIVVKETGEEEERDGPASAPADADVEEDNDNNDEEEEEEYDEQIQRQLTEIIDAARRRNVNKEDNEKKESDSSNPEAAVIAGSSSSSLHAPGPTAIIRLTQHKSFAEGAEFRAFVLIQRTKNADDGNSDERQKHNLPDASQFDVTVLGLCQKRVDQVFGFLLDERHNKAIAAAAEEAVVRLFSTSVPRGDNNDDGEEEHMLADTLFNHLVAPTTPSAARSDDEVTPTEAEGHEVNKANSNKKRRDAITDIVVGIDITIESASLPIYVLGMSAVACGSEQWPFITDAEHRGEATTESNRGTNPFLGPIIEKQSIPFCRLFRTLADLKAHYVGAMAAAGRQMAPSQQAPQRTIFAASSQSDLVGDGKQMFSHVGLPKELKDTESFMSALRGGAAGGSGEGDAASMDALLRHLQNQQQP